MRRHWIRRAPFFILIAIAGVTAFVFIVMQLWNALMPEIFHLQEITFWQALGLLVLSKILFGSFRGGPRPYWKNKARQKWMNMTPEERERFKEEWGRRCGPDARRERRGEGRQWYGGEGQAGTGQTGGE